ncbi:MAG: RNA polymerase sigma-54 factor, partial [Acidobacteria bacterium]|nr:RNA polymerase sigma-54 factor [Acidobacteriota bacterium]
MAIQQKLQTRLSQKLILTPSLQQAIKLLPMSTVELVDYVNQEVVENPVLEEIPDAAAAAEPAEQTGKAATDPPDPRDAEPTADGQDAWDDADYEYFFGDYLEDSYRPHTPTEFKELPPIENTLSTGTSLSDHLLRQLGEQTDDDELREIGSAIIGNLNEDGYLDVASMDEIASMGPWPPAEVERALALVQTLD